MFEKYILLIMLIVGFLFIPISGCDEEGKINYWEGQLDKYPVEYCQEKTIDQMNHGDAEDKDLCDYQKCLDDLREWESDQMGKQEEKILIDKLPCIPECSIILTINDKTWSVCGSECGMPYACAVCYASLMKLCNYRDWRLPTLEELESLYDPTNDTNENNGLYAYIRKPFKLSDPAVWSNYVSPGRNDAWDYSYYNGIVGKPGNGNGYIRALIIRP